MQALKSIKTKATSWVEWNEQIKAKRVEMAAITGLGDAIEQHRRAHQGLVRVIERANQSRYTPGGGMTFANQPQPRNPLELTDEARQTDDGTLEVAAALLTHLDGLDEKMSDAARQEDPQKALFVSETRASLRERRDALEDARQQVETLQAQKDRVASELTDLEEKAPKASASTLGTMAKERDQAAKERDRIAAKLKELEVGASRLEKAQQDADAAREQLEEAEAMADLGEADPEAVNASKATVEKAQKALDELRQQGIVHRGMARKLEEATTYHDTLANTYNQAVIRIRGVDLATREAALVKHAEAFQEHLADLARLYADLEDAQPHAIYGPARLEIQMPTLHHHPDADSINSVGYIMTPSGREE